VLVAVGLLVAVRLLVGVGVGVFDGVAVGVPVGVAVGVLVGVGVFAGVAVGVGVGVAGAAMSISIRLPTYAVWLPSERSCSTRAPSPSYTKRVTPPLTVLVTTVSRFSARGDESPR
jgi:hypothetical protein